MLSNVPLLIASSVGYTLKRNDLSWVLWHQDVTSAAMVDEMRRLPPVVAKPISRALERRERWTFLRADAVVAIGPAFMQQYGRRNVSRSAMQQYGRRNVSRSATT